MFNYTRYTVVKIIGFVVAAILLVVLGFGLGRIGSTPNPKNSSVNKTSALKNNEARLTNATVEKFLITYFTKKDLSENRDRYKSFMTEAMYNQEVVAEDKPSNQAYKGYVVDYVFQSADIYINQEKLIVLAEVYYTSTLLTKQYDYTDAAKDVRRETMLRIEYKKVGDEYRVSSMKQVAMTDANQDDHSNHVHDFSKEPHEHEE